MPRVKVGVLRREELPFLMELWGMPEVMRYADELPRLRGWKKSDDPSDAWREYRRRRAELGPLYTQLVVRLPGGKPIGESFFAPLPEDYTFGQWSKPRRKATVLGDLKLLPEYWGRGRAQYADRLLGLFFLDDPGRAPGAQRWEAAGELRGLPVALQPRVSTPSHQAAVKDRSKTVLRVDTLEPHLAGDKSPPERSAEAAGE